MASQPIHAPDHGALTAALREVPQAAGIGLTSIGHDRASATVPALLITNAVIAARDGRIYGAREHAAVGGLVAAIRMAVGIEPGLDPVARAVLSELAGPVKIEILAEPADERMPALVRAAAAIALASPWVRREVWMAFDFPNVIRPRGVDLVPAVRANGWRVRASADERELARAIVRAVSAAAAEP